MNPESHPGTDSRVRWSAITDIGRRRSNNEDVFLTMQADAREVRYLGRRGEDDFASGDLVFAVSDGMGGAGSGELASKLTVEKITRLLPKACALAMQGLPSGINDVLEEICHAIHSDLARLGRAYEECRGMGATLTLAVVMPGRLHFAHVGDSRLYYLPHAGGIRQVTHDHSHIGYLRRQGKISEREARNHPRRNVLEQALGAGVMILDPQIGEVSFEPGDRFLICSDGVCDGLWDHAMDDLIRQPTAVLRELPPAERLVKEAVSESGRDNATAIVIEAL
jgi:PPM family protein phosphatase